MIDNKIGKLSSRVNKIMYTVGLMTIIFSITSSSVYSLFWDKTRTNQKIISQLPSTYTSNVSITSYEKVQQVTINKSMTETKVDVLQPASLSGMSFNYTKDTVAIKYKNLQCILKDNYTMNICPLSIIVNVEQMVKNGEYSECEVRDNTLIVSGSYDAFAFTLEADLRKNKITSISIPEINLRADYLT